jgi:pseudouridine-5'-phosphate glycosidase
LDQSIIDLDHRSIHMTSNLKFELSQEVQRAMAQRTAVVALESTIITHGMPYPANVETALAVEAAVRAQGATPATIAVLDGVVHVGLEREQLERVASLGSAACSQSVASRRRPRRRHRRARRHDGRRHDVAGASRRHSRLCHRWHWWCASRRRVSMDVSADLAELARTPVAVVCAGVKSILDIPRTVERLETDGVSLVAFQTDEVPGVLHAPLGRARPAARSTHERDVALLIAANHRLALE